MRTKILLFGLLPGAFSFLLSNPVRAADSSHSEGVPVLGGAHDESDSSGAVRIDVVVDMSPAGKKVAPATPARPVYYLPMPIGYKEFGYAPFFQRKPPPADEVEQMLSLALAQQGYQVMTKQNHPSLVLYFWWGYMAPSQKDQLQFASVKPSTSGSASVGSLAQVGSAEAAEGDASDEQMRQLVAGDTFGFETNPMDPRKQEVLKMVHDPRYYILVSAFAFDSWLKNLKEAKSGQPVVDQPVLLWRAHISTELWGHYFDQVAQTLVTAGAPWFGRETPGPQVATTSVAPEGRVLLGTPEVKDYASKPSPAP